MERKSLEQEDDAEWEAAQAALLAAQKMPDGPERIKALRKAGQTSGDNNARSPRQIGRPPQLAASFVSQHRRTTPRPLVLARHVPPTQIRIYLMRS